jgi:hypothetical protein
MMVLTFNVFLFLAMNVVVSSNSTPGKVMELPAPVPKPSISAAHSKVQGPSLPITYDFYDEDECMRRAIGAVEHMLLQTNSPSSGQQFEIEPTKKRNDVSLEIEPSKKRNAARMLYGNGKKRKVECNGESYKFSPVRSVVNLIHCLIPCTCVAS